MCPLPTNDNNENFVVSALCLSLCKKSNTIQKIEAPFASHPRPISTHFQKQLF